MAEQHMVVAHPWFECPRCRRIIVAADHESARLLNEGASEQVVLNASHEPRFATLDDHARFMVAEGWSTVI